jgi:hypothetical protein
VAAVVTYRRRIKIGLRHSHNLHSNHYPNSRPRGGRGPELNEDKKDILQAIRGAGVNIEFEPRSPSVD